MNMIITLVIAVVCGVGIFSQMVHPLDFAQVKLARAFLTRWMYGQMHTRFLMWERACEKKCEKWGREVYFARMAHGIARGEFYWYSREEGESDETQGGLGK